MPVQLSCSKKGLCAICRLDLGLPRVYNVTCALKRDENISQNFFLSLPLSLPLPPSFTISLPLSHTSLFFILYFPLPLSSFSFLALFFPLLSFSLSSFPLSWFSSFFLSFSLLYLLFLSLFYLLSFVLSFISFLFIILCFNLSYFSFSHSLLFFIFSYFSVIIFFFSVILCSSCFLSLS